jgi:hypothetical protein
MPRISLLCSPRLHRRLQRCLPWGTQAAAVRRICELLCDRIEKDGILIIEQLVSGTYDPLDETLKGRERKKG